MTYTEQLQQKFFSLPESLQDAVRSDTNNQFLVSLAKKYMLNDDQQMDLVHTSAYVLLGEVSRADFAHRIADIDGVGEQAAQVVAKMIDEKLFAPLSKEITEAAKNRIPRTPVEDSKNIAEEASPQEQEVFVQKTPLRISEDATPPIITPPEPEIEAEEPLEVENAPNPIPTPEPSPITPEPEPQPIEALETTQTQDEDLPKETGVITIPTITVTKPPRFIPLKDLKQGSIKMRPAPEGIPSRNTMPSFSKPSAGAIHTLKNDAPRTPIAPAQTPSVLPRIEPTPEKLASIIQPSVPAPMPPQPRETPITQGGSSDPYREPIEP